MRPVSEASGSRAAGRRIETNRAIASAMAATVLGLVLLAEPAGATGAVTGSGGVAGALTGSADPPTAVRLSCGAP